MYGFFAEVKQYGSYLSKQIDHVIHFKFCGSLEHPIGYTVSLNVYGSLRVASTTVKQQRMKYTNGSYSSHGTGQWEISKHYYMPFVELEIVNFPENL